MLTVVPWYWACLESPDVPADWLAVRLFSQPTRKFVAAKAACRQTRLSQKEMVQLANCSQHLVQCPWHMPMLSAFPRSIPSIPIAFSRQPKFLV